MANPDAKHLKLDFDVGRVFEAYRHRAVRRAVMIPLFGKQAPTVLLDIPKALDLVRTKWRRRCYQLSKAGWHPLRTWSAVTYAGNCPPFGVQTTTTARCCRRPLACPFCFGRDWVLYPFRKLETILYGVSGPYMVGQQLWEQDNDKVRTAGEPLLPLLRPDLKIVWFRRKIISYGDPEYPFDLENVRHHVHHVVAAVRRWRNIEQEQFGSDANTIQFNIYPVPTKQVMVLVRSGVLLVPQAVPESEVRRFVEAQPKKGPKTEAAAGMLECSKENLFKAFTKAIRYPSAAMRGLPDWTAATLNALKRFRGISTPGKLPPGAQVEFSRPGRAGDDGLAFW